MFLSDLRIGLRMLLKEPGFTVLAVLTLALGIGANTSIFSVVNGIVLRPLPFPEPDQLVAIWETDEHREALDNSSPANFYDWQQNSRSFSGMAASFGRSFNLTDVDIPERIRGNEVSPNFFDVLGVDAAIGRTFLLGESAPDAPSVVLSHALWQRRFGGAPDLVGQSIALNGEHHVVVGVMPPWFRFGGPQEGGATGISEAWTRAKRAIPEPLVEEVEDLTTLRTLSYLRVFGRLEPDVPFHQAQSEMDVLALQLEQTYPESNTGIRIHLVPLHEQSVGEVRPALMVLWGAVGFVLLIACANVANLLMARASGREREMAVRASLGATRGRLMSQLLVESLLLSLLGGVCGVAFAIWGTDLLLAMEPGNLPRISEVGVDLEVLGFSLVVALVTGLIFGLVPSLYTSKLDLQGSLKEGAGFGLGREKTRVLRSFVIAEVGLALILLTGAGLMIQSFLYLRSVDPGFETDNILTFRVRLPEAEYVDDDSMIRFYDQSLERFRRLSGVSSAGGVLGVPLSRDISGRFAILIEGRPEPPPEERAVPGYQIVSPGYFRTMGVPLLRGRDFSAQDDAEQPDVVIINQTMARSLWAGDDPLGQRISFNGDDWIEIVGIVSDVHHYNLTDDPRPELYLPYAQSTLPFMTFVVKTVSEPLAVVPAVRAQLREIDPNLPVFGVTTLDQTLRDSVARPRFQVLLLGLFAAVALILAVTGIYGLLAYLVSRSRRDIGIRMALGAPPRDILRLVVGQGLALAFGGLALGLIGALALTRILSSFLFGVTATDPWTFAGVCVVITAATFLASLLPARRAMRIEPVSALRLE
jgi:putative ABC transport system permease protein